MMVEARDTKFKILVVDDEPKNVKIIEGFLIPEGYEIISASDGKEAIKIVEEKRPDLILLDIMMPEMNGFETARILKSRKDTMLIPVVMITALKEVEDRVKALEAGADDFLTKPIDKTELRARIRSLIKVKLYNDYMKRYREILEEEVQRRTLQLRQALKEVKEASLETIFRLSQAAEYKDEETGAHILRMSRYTKLLAEQIGFNKSKIEELLYAAPLHDVGKIGIPDSILLKPGKLNKREWEIMKTHTTIGAKILRGSRSGYIKLAEVIAKTHHERWDGNGYPIGLKGEKIPIVGRISAIADVFDALISKRPYKEPFSVETAFEIIRRGRGSQFDPEITDLFLKLRDKIVDIKETYERGGNLHLGKH